jgi:hypothetical protein
VLEGPDSRRWGTCRLRRVSSAGLLSTFFFFFQAHRRGAVKSVVGPSTVRAGGGGGGRVCATHVSSQGSSEQIFAFLLESVAPPAPVGRPHSSAPSVGLPRIRSRPAIKGESAEAHPLCRLPHLRPQPHLRLLAPANDSTTGWARRDPLNPGSPGPQPAAVRHCRPRDIRVSCHLHSSQLPLSSCAGFQPTQSFCHQGMAHPRSILTALPRPSGGPTSHGQRAHSADLAYTCPSRPRDHLRT